MSDVSAATTPRSRKVGVILHGLHGGGAERVVANLMGRLAVDHDVTVMLLEEPAPDDYPLSDQVHSRVFLKSSFWERVARRLKIAWLSSRAFHMAKVKRVLDIRKFRKAQHFDVVLGFLESGNYLAVATRCGEKTCVSIRNHTTKKLEAHPDLNRQANRKKLDRFADKVICVSEEVAHDVIDNFGVPKHKVRVINNWVDRPEVEHAAAEPIEDVEFEEFVAEHPVLIVNSGRIDSQKGQWHLIRAFRELHEAHPETGLVILGKGRGPFNLEDFIRDQVEVNGMGEHVLLAGRKTNPFSYMKRADVFVLSSLFEGFSNVVLEAMAVGLPVVCTDCSGVRELLTPQRPYGTKVTGVTHGDFGIVVPELGLDQPETLELTEAESYLAQAMRDLVEDPSLREHYRELGYERIEAFTPEVIMRQWLDIVDEA